VSRATLVPTVPVTSTETRSRSPCQSLLLTRLVGPVSLTFSLPSSLSPPRSPRYLDTNKGRDVGKFVVKVYPPEHTLLRHKSTAHAPILLPPPLYANETFSLPPLPFPLLAPLSPRSPPVSDVCHRSQGVWDCRRHSRSPGNGGAMAS
jgi:hypothetical protein